MLHLSHGMSIGSGSHVVKDPKRVSRWSDTTATSYNLSNLTAQSALEPTRRDHSGRSFAGRAPTRVHSAPLHSPRSG